MKKTFHELFLPPQPQRISFSIGILPSLWQCVNKKVTNTTHATKSKEVKFTKKDML